MAKGERFSMINCHSGQSIESNFVYLNFINTKIFPNLKIIYEYSVKEIY